MNGLINEKWIIDAYVHLRETNSKIPSETLDFMKKASLETLKNLGERSEPPHPLLGEVVLPCGIKIIVGNKYYVGISHPSNYYLAHILAIVDEHIVFKYYGKTRKRWFHSIAPYIFFNQYLEFAEKYRQNNLT